MRVDLTQVPWAASAVAVSIAVIPVLLFLQPPRQLVVTQPYATSS